jgi:hypothetical protein
MTKCNNGRAMRQSMTKMTTLRSTVRDALDTHSPWIDTGTRHLYARRIVRYLINGGVDTGHTWDAVRTDASLHHLFHVDETTSTHNRITIRCIMRRLGTTDNPPPSPPVAATTADQADLLRYTSALFDSPHCTLARHTKCVYRGLLRKYILTEALAQGIFDIDSWKDTPVTSKVSGTAMLNTVLNAVHRLETEGDDDDDDTVPRRPNNTSSSPVASQVPPLVGSTAMAWANSTPHLCTWMPTYLQHAAHGMHRHLGYAPSTVYGYTNRIKYVYLALAHHTQRMASSTEDMLRFTKRETIAALLLYDEDVCPPGSVPRRNPKAHDQMRVHPQTRNMINTANALNQLHLLGPTPSSAIVYSDIKQHRFAGLVYTDDPPPPISGTDRVYASYGASVAPIINGNGHYPASGNPVDSTRRECFTSP